ncbi:MAG: hypothetical protein K8R77_04795, partial [Anaerolineaceae bacterium]|nr:hypothetical protein [Anaerolineaceae bacterium]
VFGLSGFQSQANAHPHDWMRAIETRLLLKNRRNPAQESRIFEAVFPVPVPFSCPHCSQRH